jgi:PAS domain S-box-containing protein
MQFAAPAQGLHTIIDQCPIGILVQQAERIVYINRAGVDCLGYASQSDLIGRPLESLWESASYATLSPNFHKLTVQDQQLFIGELRMRCKSGKLIDAEVHHAALSIDGVDATMISFRDVTLAKKLEMELRSAQKLEAVGRLAAGIAHEINTPSQFVGDSLRFLSESYASVRNTLAAYRNALAALAATSAQAAQLREELRQAEETADVAYIESNAPDALEHAAEGVARISTIVGAMKEFAHPDRGPKSSADLNRALQATLTIARSEYKYVAEVQTELGEIPPVTCHLGELNQVFLNLLVNAAHAISDAPGKANGKGHIRIRTSRHGDMVKIEFEDTGCGIPADIRERVFDPFFTTKEVGRGTGQGLAIARSIVVDKHAGSLTFESDVGKGTTFTILLPISAPGETDDGETDDGGTDDGDVVAG